MAEEISNNNSSNKAADSGEGNEDFRTETLKTNKDEQGKNPSSTGQNDPIESVPSEVDLTSASESSGVTDVTTVNCVSSENSRKEEKERKIGVKNAINKWLLQVQPIVPRKMSGEVWDYCDKKGTASFSKLVLMEMNITRKKIPSHR